MATLRRLPGPVLIYGPSLGNFYYNHLPARSKGEGFHFQRPETLGINTPRPPFFQWRHTHLQSAAICILKRSTLLRHE